MRLFGLDIRLKSEVEKDVDAPSTRARVQRLEIAFGELVEHFSKLQAAHAKLRNQYHGSQGGRPSVRSSTQGDLPLDAVPLGDKAGLRRALGVVPSSRFAHKE